MSQTVVDTDVASYIFNWHSMAEQYAGALRGSELVLSFMTIAELRMGAISAGWGDRRRLLLEQFIQGFEVVYADNNLCTIWARIRADARAAGRALSPRMPGSRPPHWRLAPQLPQTTVAISSTSRNSGCSHFDTLLADSGEPAGFGDGIVVKVGHDFRATLQGTPIPRAACPDNRLDDIASAPARSHLPSAPVGRRIIHYEHLEVRILEARDAFHASVQNGWAVPCADHDGAGRQRTATEAILGILHELFWLAHREPVSRLMPEAYHPVA